jgi:hypothetical protein
MNSPYLKFVAPALLALVATLVTAIAEGTLDGVAFEVGFVGLAAATVAFIVTNDVRGLGRYAKSLAPAVLAGVAIGIHYLVTGEFNEVDARAAISAGVAVAVTFIVPNTGNDPVVR